jgi:biofilm PGA synthesis N-glycosyltransferase PgaC
MIFLQIVLWSAIAVVLHTYIGYPVGIYMRSRREKEAEEETGTASKVGLPFVTVLIPAHNEERWIARKIENAIALEYPRERRHILVACDGCTDRTVAIAESYAQDGVEVQQYPQRRGKTALLNRVIPTVATEIVMVTDATAQLSPETLRLLANHFKDPQVGCVTGPRVCVSTESAASEGEGLYWRYEAWIKRSESRLGTCLGANGQLMAVRKALFPHLPDINDDFYVGMKILVFDRAKVLFEPEAKAFIPAAATMRQELERKIRTNVCFLRDMHYLRQGLNPLRSPIWWRLLSHHVMRRLVPFAMIAALAGALLLWHEGGLLYRLVAAAQVAFYSGAIIGFLLERWHARLKMFYFPFYFCFANLAVLLAWTRWARGTQQYAWQRAERVLPTVQPPTREPTSGEPI